MKSGLFVRLIFRGNGTAGFCPLCDRLTCQKCHRVLITGRERSCCGVNLMVDTTRRTA
jgi:hypothetical protein